MSGTGLTEVAELVGVAEEATVAVVVAAPMEVAVLVPTSVLVTVAVVELVALLVVVIVLVAVLVLVLVAVAVAVGVEPPGKLIAKRSKVKVVALVWSRPDTVSPAQLCWLKKLATSVPVNVTLWFSITRPLSLPGEMTR